MAALLGADEALALWRAATAVCMDVDSTVCTDEAIDRLAEFCGVGSVVAEWTRKAMGGAVPFETALAERLKIIKPTLAQFGPDGEYVGFDEDRPTARSGGKAEVIRMLQQRPGNHRYGVDGAVVMLGDGVTDMEARPPADLFIGFGGNVVRDKVRQGADWFVHSMDELRQALDA